MLGSPFSHKELGMGIKRNLVILIIDIMIQFIITGSALRETTSTKKHIKDIIFVQVNCML